MGEAGRQRAVEQFSWAGVADRTVAVYEAVVAVSGPDPARISRRRILQIGALTPAAFLAACAETLLPSPSPRPSATATLEPVASPTATHPTPVPSPTPAPSPAPVAPVLYRGAALADGRSATLQRNVSVLTENGIVRWIRPTGGEESASGATVIDAAGATIVPGLVDAHTHLTGAGGVNWIARFNDPPATLAATGEANAALAWRSGVRWVRDLGAPIVTDPVDGQVRAASLGVRDRLRGKPGFPEIRAAGSWVTRAGSLSGRISAEAANADQLLAVALQQLDQGADLVKLYLESPGGAPAWSIAETRRVVDAVHARGARVAAHAGRIRDIQTGVEAGVDTIEHGTELDAYTARRMREQGTILVSTLTVFHSWLSFGATTTVPFFAAPSSRARVQRPARRRPGRHAHRPRRRRAHRRGLRLRRWLEPGKPHRVGVPGSRSAPGCRRSTRWRRSPGAVARHWGSRMRGCCGRAARPTSSWSTATRSPIRAPSGGSGATAELPATIGRP